MPCIGWGLRIRTPVPLPGTIAATDGDPADIDIDFGAAPLWQERCTWGPYRVADADLFEIAMAGLARFTCRDRRRIIIAPELGARDEAIGAMLIATVLPALLWARGEIVLHCAAAARPGSAGGTLVAGDSGSGKSTLLARAVKRGDDVIAEDSVCLRLDGDQVLASGLPAGIWLRRGGGDLRDFRPIPVPRQCMQHPVRRMVAIAPTGHRRRLLTGPERLAALLRHRHRHRITMLLGGEADFILPFARIAQKLRIVSIPSPNLL